MEKILEFKTKPFLFKRQKIKMKGNMYYFKNFDYRQNKVKGFINGLDNIYYKGKIKKNMLILNLK